MTNYTERGVRDFIEQMDASASWLTLREREYMAKLADMLAEREKAVPVYQRRHADSHTWVDCSPEEYKIWHENNRRILYTHPAAQESGR